MAKLRTSEALTTLMSLKPTTAILLTFKANPADGMSPTVKQNDVTEQEIDANLLEKNDIVKVLRGTKIPADGVVVSGDGSVDEAMLTGESMPVTKQTGDNVIGSTVLLEGMLHVRVTHVGEESTLSQILALMEDAVASKAPIQAYADQVRLIEPAGVLLTTVVRSCRP
jgi:Cu+-exporting ATPase